MKKLLAVLFLVLIGGCTTIPHESNMVVTDASHLDSHIGKMITIKGQVSNTKIPTIIGVNVLSNDPDLRGKMAEATGVLEKWTDTKESIAAADAEMQIQTRRQGTYYRLFDPKTQTEAQVKKIK